MFNNTTMSGILVVIITTVVLMGSLQAATEQQYQSTRQSLINYQVPEWYQDAKFGIWPHWGVYSVPAYRGDHAAEWYGRWMYCMEKEPDNLVQPRNVWNDYFDKRALKTAAHHAKTYGDPHTFGYHKFASMWKAEKWNPDQWAQMAVDAGAKFFCMMGMHHDGFALYDSDLTRWNAVDMGPKRDLCGELAKAVRARGLRFGVSNHFAWNYEFFGFYHRNGFAKGQKELADFYSGGEVNDAYLKRWWGRTTELVDKCQPDLYYFDWGWHGKPWLDAQYHEKFAAFLYNRAISWDRGTYGNPGIVLNSKFNHMSSYCVRDLERSKMSKIQSRVWQTDTSISVHSWGYATEDEYYSADHLIDTLMDIISKNGILMLNFGPKADGTVPDEYLKPLMAMGDWLKVNGQAVYGTRPYGIFGEGPAPKEGHEKHTAKSSYDGPSIRFTRNKDNTVLYATALQWPGEVMTIKSFAKGKFDTSRIQSMRLLGTAKPLQWKQTAAGLEISMPQEPAYGLAYPVQIQFIDKIPAVK